MPRYTIARQRDLGHHSFVGGHGHGFADLATGKRGHSHRKYRWPLSGECGTGHPAEHPAAGSTAKHVRSC